MANQQNTKNYITLLDADITAATVSDGISRDMYGANAIQSTGAAGGNTFSIQGSINGVTFEDIVTDKSTDSIVQITGLWRYIRVERTGSGTNSLTVVLFSGDKQRK